MTGVSNEKDTLFSKNNNNKNKQQTKKIESQTIPIIAYQRERAYVYIINFVIIVGVCFCQGL